jgi:uncharacterized membrane-anchored protein
VLATFALGTAAGRFTANELRLGYLTTSHGGGLGFGDGTVALVMSAAIAAGVAYVAVRRNDIQQATAAEPVPVVPAGDAFSTGVVAREH